jgi:hypothetical protein
VQALRHLARLGPGQPPVQQQLRRLPVRLLAEGIGLPRALLGLEAEGHGLQAEVHGGPGAGEEREGRQRQQRRGAAAAPAPLPGPLEGADRPGLDRLPGEEGAQVVGQGLGA